MIKSVLNKVKEKSLSFIGDIAFFFGSVMADGFEHRMQEIAEEEEKRMAKEEAEVNKFPSFN